MDATGFLPALVAYLAVGAVLYRRTYPGGLFPQEADPELERLRRTGRRRVLPLPDAGERR